MAWRREKWARESARLLAGISRSVCGKPQFRSFFFFLRPECCLRDHEWKLKDQIFWGWSWFQDSDPIFQPVSHFPFKSCEHHWIKKVSQSHFTKRLYEHTDHSTNKGKGYIGILLFPSFKLVIIFQFSAALTTPGFGLGKVSFSLHLPTLLLLTMPSVSQLLLPVGIWCFSGHFQSVRLCPGLSKWFRLFSFPFHHRCYVRRQWKTNLVKFLLWVCVVRLLWTKVVVSYSQSC